MQGSLREAIERQAYRAGWLWGLACGWVAGMLGGTLLVGLMTWLTRALPAA